MHREKDVLKQAMMLLAGEKHLLEIVSNGASLSSVLDALARHVEKLSPGLLCSILLLDGDGLHLRHGAAPNLPESYNRAVDGIVIGPRAGSCGTAAYRGKPVVVSDIARDPLWVDYRELALTHGLRACWSTPIFASQGAVLGTFALYYHKPRNPSPHELQFIERASHLAAIAIERNRSQRELRYSEANYRSFVEGAPYGIYRSTANGKLLMVNPTLVQMLGYESAEELLAADMATDIYRYPCERARLIELHRDQERFEGVEVEWKRKDGTPLAVRLSGRVVRDGQSALACFETIVEDVTERRALEQQVRQAQKMEAIGRLSAGIAHDFNNLLTVILGYTELLLEHHEPGSSSHKEATEIQRAAGQARSLTTQLLAYSRKQVVEPRVIHLNDIVASMEEMLQRLIGENIELVTRLDPAPGQVKADRSQLEQVILNLAANARDAMPQGGRLLIQTANAELGQVFVREHSGARPGAYVMLAVSDTGTGMDAETQAHIFEPFFTTKEQGKGTGLGLASVYGIVKQNSGYICVVSKPGHGTAFEVYLPRVHEPVEFSAPRSQPVGTARASETILLAEDNEAVRELTRECLERRGYTVLAARDGYEAVQICEQHEGTIHLLLTDAVMPGMGGGELAQQVTRLRPGTKVLYMSGYADNDIVSHGALESGVAFLQKPFTLDSLQAKVREVLHGGS